MAKCDFKVNFSGSAQELFDKVKALIQENNGTVHGGPTSGSFSVRSITGTYSVSGQTVRIIITKKPFFISCSLIEKFVRSNVPTVLATSIHELI